MAATELGTYYISLVPSALNITGHAQKAFAPVQGIATAAGNESGGRFSSAFGQATSGVGHALSSALKVGTLAAGAAIAAAGGVGLKTAAELETAQISFTTMLGSAEKAKSFLGDLKNFAAKTPFDLPGLNTAAKSLISIGISTDKVLPIMTTLGNVTSGMGTGAEGIKRATVALQQMNAAQKISAEDLNQLRDAGIPVYELLTAATGKTTAQIAEMRDKGELGKAELDALMTALETGVGFERFNGLMEEQSKSISGLWSTLKDTFGVGMADVIKPFLPAMKATLGGAISFLEDTAVPGLTGGAQKVVDGVGQFYAVMNDPYLRTTDNGFIGFMQDAGRLVAMSGIPEGVAWIGRTVKDMWTNIGLAGGAVQPLTSDGLVSRAFLNLGTVIGDATNVVQSFWFTLTNPKASAAKYADGGMTGIRLGAVQLGETLREGVLSVRAFFRVLNNPEADVTSDGGVGYFERMAMNVRDFIGALDFSGWGNFWGSLMDALGPVGTNLTSIKESAVTLGPAIGQFASQVGAIGPNVAAAGLDIFAGLLSFLADHTDWIIAHMPLLVAGFVAWKVAQMGVNVVTAASVPLMVAANVARTTAAIAEWRLVTAQRAALVSGVQLTTSENIGMMARIRGTTATVAHNVAVLGSNVAARAAAAGQWLLNAAMSANPVALIVKGIFVLVGAMVWFFTQTEMGRGIVQAAWAGIQFAVGWVVDWFTNTALPFINSFFGAIGAGATGAQASTGGAFAGIQSFVAGVFTWFQEVALPIAAAFFTGVGLVAMWLWNNAIVPAFQGIQAVIGVVWGIVSGIFNAWVFVLSEIVFPVIRALWADVVQPAFFLAGEFIGFWWNLVFGIFQIFVSVMQNIVFPAIRMFWEGVVQPVFTAIAAIIGWAWNTIIFPIFLAVVAFVVDKLGPPFNVLRSIVEIAWGGISTFVSGIWNGLRDNIFGPMGTFLTVDVPGFWDKATTMIEVAWNKVQEIAKKPIKWVIESVINDGVIGTFNKVADALPGVNPLKPVALPPGWYRGGVLPGYRTTKSDDVLTPMRSGEGVLVPEAVRGIGPSTIHALNRAGNNGGVAAVRELVSSEGFAKGGLIRPAAGPITSGYRGPGRADHDGVDIGAAMGSTIVAAGDGLIVDAGWHNWGGGNHVDIQHDGNLRTEYYHMSEILARAGQRVTKGDPIGRVGSTGNSTGPHLHYEVHLGDGLHSSDGVNPMAWLDGGGEFDPNGSMSGGGGGGFNPFAAVIDGIAGLVKGVFPQGGQMVDTAVGLGKKVGNDMVSWIGDKFSGVFDVADNVAKGAKAVASSVQVTAWATEALMKTGNFDPWNLSSLLRRIDQESGGDPRAVNNWDSNAAAGIPSKGLMQTIEPTYKAYRDPSLPNDIFDPVSNIVAAINYTRAKYGNLREGWDRPGGYALGGIVPTLFDKGGYLPTGPTMISNERDHPEMILTDQQWAAMYSLAQQAEREPERIDLHVHGDGMSPQMVGTIAGRQIMRKRGRR